jgi:hypothetical protein
MFLQHCSEEFARELAHEKEQGSAQAGSRGPPRQARNAIAYAQQQGSKRNQKQN